MALKIRLYGILPSHRLTPRQYEIALLAMDGMSDKSIGLALGISKYTVKNLLQQAYTILNISSRLELALVLWWDTEGRYKEDSGN